MSVRASIAAAIVVRAAAPAGTAAAQAGSTSRSPDPALARVDSLIAADRLDAARSALEQWSAANTNAPGNTRAAAGLLRGRLARSWPEAEQAYLATALAYPVTPQAPEALLRLGQGLTTAADPATGPDAARRAVAYLERLVADYPTSPLRSQGYLWLARALRADGRTAAACRRLQLAPSGAADSITASLIESEKQRSCNQPLVQPAPRP